MNTLYTLPAARRARAAGASWSIRIEYVGYNGKNASGRSRKFWSCSGNGRGRVSVRYGRLGTYGQTIEKDFAYVEEKLPAKLRKGYEYDRGTCSTFEPPKPKPAPKPAPAKPALPALTGPFSLIRWLRQADAAWEALDADGTRLLDLPEVSAKALLAYPQINVWPA